MIGLLMNRIQLLLFIVTIAHVAWVHSIFIPSVKFQSCNANSNSTDLTNCKSLIIVQGIVDTNGDGFGFSFTLDQSTPIVDQNNRQYAPETPIMVTVYRSPISFKYRFSKLDSVYNTYATKQKKSSSSGCPTGKLCCQDMIYGLAHNKTKYTAYSLLDLQPNMAFTAKINVVQNTISEVLHLDQNTLIAQTTAVSAQIIGNMYQSNVFLGALTGFKVVHESVYENSELGNYIPEPFVVKFDAFYPTTPINSIGMVMNPSVHCSPNFEDQVRVQGGSPYDQFSAFRSNTLAGNILKPMGLEMEREAVSKLESTGLLNLKLNSKVSTWISLTLDSASNFKLIRLFGQPHLVDSGLLPYTEGDTNIVMFIDIMNIDSKYQGDFLVEPKTCCRSSVCTPADTQFIIERQKNFVIPPSSTHRFRFLILASQLLTSSGGYCDISVSQHGVTDLTLRVNFVLTSVPPLATGSTPLENARCPDPTHIVYSKEGRRYCRPPCSGERRWDSDKMLCVALNCVAVYEGYRNFWNDNTGFCETVAVCTEDQIYDQLTNECRARSTTTPPNTSPGNNTSPSLPPPPVTRTPEDALRDVAQPDCGEHGHVSESGSSCICDPGYSTDWLQTEQTQWCSKKVSTTVPPITNPQQPYARPKKETKVVQFFHALKDLPLYMRLLIGFIITGVCLSILIIIVVIVVCCIRRRRRKNRRAKRKMMRKRRRMKRRMLYAEGDDDDNNVESIDDNDANNDGVRRSIRMMGDVHRHSS